MPTYDYHCDTCGTFEAVHRISDPALAQCPTCGGPVRRLISPGSGLIFKGSGFYITDYRKQEYKDQAKEESRTATEKPAGDPKAAGAGDAKPAVLRPGDAGPRAAGESKAAPPATPPPSSAPAAPSGGGSGSGSSGGGATSSGSGGTTPA